MDNGQETYCPHVFMRAYPWRHEDKGKGDSDEGEEEGDDDSDDPDEDPPSDSSSS